MAKKRAMMLGLDGADPLLVKRMISEGKLPNMKKLLEQGIATENLDMLGVLPTITPPNWATLACGAYPATHGVTCFLNHTLGKSLGITEINWDSNRIEAELVWETFAKEDKRSIMLNYCEAWPPRIDNDKQVIIDGVGVVPFLRSSAEFQKLVFLSEDYPEIKLFPHNVSQSSSDCVMFGDQIEKFANEEEKKDKNVGMTREELEALATSGHFTDYGGTTLLESQGAVLYDISYEEAANSDSTDKLYSPLKPAENWSFEVPENALEATVPINNSLVRRFALITASNGEDYDTLTWYANKKSDNPLAIVKVGDWSEPIFDTFLINDKKTKVAYYLRIVNLTPTSGKFYISHVLKVEDDTYYYPKSLLNEMMEAVGPMCYMATIERHTPEGDEICYESFDKIHEWHEEATHWLFEKYPDWQLYYIHLHSIDLYNHWYIEQAVEGGHPDWERHAELIERIYELNDRFVGEMMKYMDEDTAIFVCADHAAIPRTPGYHNPGIGELSGINTKVMSELGYTVIDPVPGVEGLYTIDWTKTKAINHRTSYIYVNLKGRDPEGIVEPEEYDDLVQQIISDLYAYRDPASGERVIAFAMTKEEMGIVGLGGDHCGDIFFQLTKDFGMQHGNAPGGVTNLGYSLGCLCIMGGGGLKAGETLARPVRNVDIVPTICHLVGTKMPAQVEGGVIYQALAE
ncbi:MAG: alkaline phosphatase family protein [Desulfitobacterium sp.]